MEVVKVTLVHVYIKDISPLRFSVQTTTDFYLHYTLHPFIQSPLYTFKNLPPFKEISGDCTPPPFYRGGRGIMYVPPY